MSIAGAVILHLDTTPNTTGIEIEQRYIAHIVKPELLDETKSVEIRQGYLPQSPHHVLRIRISNDRALYTLKKGTGRQRIEKERSATLADAEYILSSTDYIIHKRRYRFTDSPNWVLDVYLGALSGLVMAECELTDIRQEPPPPPAAFTPLQEVTDTINNFGLALLVSDLAKLGERMNPQSLVMRQLGVKTIVLTGGPGSGKSTALDQLKKDFGERIAVVPEAASIVIGQLGLRPPDTTNRIGVSKFQQTIYAAQRAFENGMRHQAQEIGQRLIVVDRGTMDGAAYLAGGVTEFEQLCGISAQTEYALYDTVFILTLPNPEVYDYIKANNPARHENYQEALALQRGIAKAWEGHHRRQIIYDAPSWPQKYSVLKKAIADLLE